MSYQVGQKVICITDFRNEPKKKPLLNFFPRVGQIYTVREILISSSGFPALRLVEIINPLYVYKSHNNPAGKKSELCFRFRHFRPVIDTKLDVFRKMCIDPELNLVKELS